MFTYLPVIFLKYPHFLVKCIKIALIAIYIKEIKFILKRRMSAGEVKKTEQPLIFHTYPLSKYTDMPEDMKQEAMEICVTATEKYTDNHELAARTIKDALDKRFGGPFHVVLGESYACAVTYQQKSLLYMYNAGNIAILVWRTVSSFS